MAFVESFLPVLNNPVQCCHLGRREGKGIGGRVIPIGLDFVLGPDIDHPLFELTQIGIRPTIFILGERVTNRLGDQVQGCSGKFGPTLRPVAPDSAMVHEPVPLIDILAGDDVFFFE